MNDGGHIGVDLGGSWIKAGLVTTDGSVSHWTRTPTPDDGPESVLERIADVDREIREETSEKTTPPTRIGVGVPGPLNYPEGRLQNPPNLSGACHRVPIKQRPAERTQSDVVVLNDADAAVLAEHWIGGMSSAWPWLEESTRNAMETFSMDANRSDVNVQRAELGNRAGVIGVSRHAVNVDRNSS